MSEPASPYPARYTAVAIGLHWIIAVLLVSMIFYGWWMEGLRERALAGEMTFAQVQGAYNWHKTAGMAVLVLSLVRLGWRLTHAVPPLPAHMKAYERAGARISHVGFYVLMIGMPLLGWLTASASDFPSLLLNNPGLPLPHLPVPNDLYETLSGLHGAGAWAILALLALHAGAALKHHILDRDDVLARMIPALRRP
jgi:cytochrome b561